MLVERAAAGCELRTTAIHERTASTAARGADASSACRSRQSAISRAAASSGTAEVRLDVHTSHDAGIRTSSCRSGRATATGTEAG